MQDRVTQGRESSSPPSTNLTQWESNLPNRIELTEIGLIDHGTLTYEAHKDLFVTLMRVERACQWATGDALVKAEMELGERYSQLLVYAEETGRNVDTLRAMMWVAERIPLVRRLTSLSWSHHQVVASLKPQEQSEFLLAAEKHGLSVSKLRQEVRKYKKGLKSGSTSTSDAANTEELSARGQSEPEASAEEASDWAAELEESNRTIESLTEQLDALKVDDQAAEIARLTQLNMQLDANHQNQLGELAKAQNDATYYRELASRLSKMLDSPHREVEARVKGLVENLAKWKNFGARLSDILGVEGKDIISTVEALKAGTPALTAGSVVESTTYAGGYSRLCIGAAPT